MPLKVWQERDSDVLVVAVYDEDPDAVTDPNDEPDPVGIFRLDYGRYSLGEKVHAPRRDVVELRSCEEGSR